MTKSTKGAASAAPALDPHRDGFRVRLRFGKNHRDRFLICLKDEKQAAKRALAMQELANDLTRADASAQAPLVLKRAGEVQTDREFREVAKVVEELCAERGKATLHPRSGTTFQQLASKWTNGALTRDYPDHVKEKKSAAKDEGRLDFIFDVRVNGLRFGDLPLVDIHLDHVEQVMRSLPEAVKRPASRRQYAQLISRVLAMAVYPCRILDASPLPRGFLPKAGKPPAYPYLYPSDDRKLLGFQTIPLGRRVLWGFLVREGMREGEALALTWADVDLKHGTVNLRENKTDNPRTWALSDGVAAALEAWRKLPKKNELQKKADLVFTDLLGAPIDPNHLAIQLRADLATAEVERLHELTTTGPNKGAMRVHDLRGTFVTLSLAMGKTESWVADRTGHESSVMINRYRRQARLAEELSLGTLDRLDVAIPELRETPKTPKGGPKGGPARGRGRRGPITKAASLLRDRASSSSRTRTWDPAINSRLLYRLS